VNYLKKLKKLATLNIMIILSLSYALPTAYVFASLGAPALSTDSGHVGDTITVSGGPFNVTAGTPIEIYWNTSTGSRNHLLNTTSGNIDGSYTVQAIIPEDSSGTYFIWVKDTITEIAAKSNAFTLLDTDPPQEKNGVPSYAVQGNTFTDEDPSSHTSSKKTKHPKLESILEQLVASESSANFEKLAQDHNILIEKGSIVQLVIELTHNATRDDLKLLEERGAIIETTFRHLVQIRIPIYLLTNILDIPAVHYISSPSKPRLAVVSEGVSVINADDAQDNGYTGSGVKVAIIDVGFDILNPEISGNINEAISFESPPDISAGGYDEHGTAVAEIVLDVAPDASLYLYQVSTEVEFLNAVQYAIIQDVDIISVSLGWEDQPTDGTGLLCEIVDEAYASGILFVTSAGNEAANHWEGMYQDADINGFHNFFGADETNQFYATEGELISLVLNWDDWPSSDQDFDLLLYDDSLSLLDYSDNYQDGSQSPTEYIEIFAPYSGTYHIVIEKYDATRNVIFDLYTGDSYIEYVVNSSSISDPGTAAGAFTVGATNYADDSLEWYSSQGPTNDGRLKPDVTAPADVQTSAYGGESFAGTSAAAPHATGAAAILLSYNATYSVDDVFTILKDTALDLGEPGPDNLYGFGRITVNTRARASYNIEWEKELGEGVGYSIEKTTDNGYIIAGKSGTNGILLKTDKMGNILWQNSLGGNAKDDWFESVKETNEGDYIATGGTYTYGLGTTMLQPKVWLVKTDINGSLLWYNTYDIGYGHEVHQTSDGGFIIAAEYHKTTWPSHFYLIKTNSDGDLEWDLYLGGGESDKAYSILETEDTDFIAVGSYIDNIHIFRVNSYGQIEWNKTLSVHRNRETDLGTGVHLTSDGGLLIVGNHANNVSLIKLDPMGELLWSKSYGRDGTDLGFSVEQTENEAFIVVGGTNSFDNNNEIYILYIDSNGNIIWNNTFGLGIGYSICKFSDENYAIIGQRNNNILLMKLSTRISIQLQTLSISTLGLGTTQPIPGNNTYENGSMATITAIPEPGWKVHHWEVDGATMGSSTTINVIMNENRSVTCYFFGFSAPEISPSIGYSGETVTVTGSNYNASTVSILWDNTTVLASDIHVYEDGGFSSNVILPDSSSGVHTISIWESQTYLAEEAFILLSVNSNPMDDTYIFEYSIPTENAFPSDIGIDSLGNIWITEFYGNKLAKLNIYSGEITEYYLPHQNSGPNGVSIDSANQIWISERGGTSYPYENPRIAQFDPLSETYIEYEVSEAMYIEVDNSDNIWFSEMENHKIGFLNRTTKLISEYSAGSPVYDLEIGTNGEIWFLGESYIYGKIGRLNPDDGTRVDYSDEILKQLRGFALDSSGNVWTHRDAANSPYYLIKFSPENGNFSFYPLNIPNRFFSIDTEDNVWFTTESRYIYKFNPETYQFISYTVSRDWRTWKIATDEGGNTWFTMHQVLYSGGNAVFPGKIGVITNFTSTLNISVIDDLGNKLSDAIVEVDGQAVNESSHGIYSLAGLRLGEYSVSIKKGGHHNITQNIELFTFNDISNVSFILNVTEIITPQYSLNISVEGSGTTDPTPELYLFDLDSQVVIEALPDSGWELSHWILDGTNVNSSTPYTVTMNQNHTLTAIFNETAQIQYNLSISVQGSGSTNPSSGIYTHNKNDQTQVTATPDSGWMLSHWLFDGSNVASTNPYTVTMNQNHTLTAVFSETVTSTSWNATLTSILGAYFSSVTVGMNESATTGFDAGGGDTLPSPAPPTGIHAYIWHQDNPSSPFDQRKLSTSLLPVEYPAEWTIKVLTIGIDGEMTISWNSTAINRISHSYSVTLITPSSSLDMRTNTQYSWAADADSTYTFTVKIAHGVIIDEVSVSDGRVDVGSTQSVGFHGYWLENNSDVTSGLFYVNGTAYTVNATGWVTLETSLGEVGQQTWTVTGVQCGSVTSFSQEAEDPVIIWDRVEVYAGGASPESIGSLVNSTVWFKARYSYDLIDIIGSTGQIDVNGTGLTWSAPNSRWEMNVSSQIPGNTSYVVSMVSEGVYGLSGFSDSAGSVTVYFTGEWSASLNVLVGENSANLFYGLDEDATVGFDAGVGDALVSPAPPSGVTAYFYYPDNPSSPIDQRKLSTSLVPVEYPVEWTFQVRTIGVSGGASVGWGLGDIAKIPENYTVTLDTPSGGMDMRTGENYSWSADADTMYSFTVSITAEIEFTLELSVGWNMVSLPVVPDDSSAASILSGVGFYQLVTWSGTGYVVASEFEVGKGYWLLVLENVNVTVSGLPADSVSLTLSPGWNMIGGPNEIVVSGDVFTGFYQLVTWTGTGYIPVTEFDPGNGYWALVLEETQIQLPPA